MTLFIVDLDGTVADDRSRKIKAGPEPRREDKPEYLAWLSYIQSHAALAEDEPIKGMSTLLRGVAGQQAIVIYLTAREEKYRDVTCAWLTKHGFPKSLLVMRPNGSWLSSAELKRARIQEWMETYKGAAIVAIDDDGSGDCAAMYLEMGIPHLHVKLPLLKEELL